MLLLYLLISIVVSGANYIISQSPEDRYYDDGWCVLESVVTGIFWPLTIGIIAAKYVKVYQEKKRGGRE